MGTTIKKIALRALKTLDTIWMETGLYIAEIANKAYWVIDSKFCQVVEKAGIAIKQFRKQKKYNCQASCA